MICGKKLSAGGLPERRVRLAKRINTACPWQVVPATILPQLLQDKDPQKSNRVMQAMLWMEKIDINALKAGPRITKNKYRRRKR